MIHIDGSFGESGGAMLRQAIGLSLLTGKPFIIENIRAGRPSPGLAMQHLTALNSAKDIFNASIDGNFLGSGRVVFTPVIQNNNNNNNNNNNISADIDIGTAGSITLLLQSFLLPSMFSGRTVHLRIKGGTDVAWSIPIDYFISVLLKQLKPYADIKIIVQSRGYYPKGGGYIEFYCEGKYKLDNINTAQKIMLANTTQKYSSIIGISHASSSLKHAKIAERQAESAKSILERAGLSANISTEYNHTLSDGSGIVLWASPENKNSSITLASDCLGERKRRAEDVGSSAAHDMIAIINKNIPCDEHLADQLIPLLGLVGGKIKTSKITGHIRSNIYVTEKFLEAKFVVDENDNIITKI